MEAPTLKEVLDKLEWSPLQVDHVGSGHYLQGIYEWEDQKWTPQISVLSDGRAFNWELNRNQYKQCTTLEEAVCNCANAILTQIEGHVREYEKTQERNRALDEYNQYGQEWADKANNVSVED